MKDGIPENWARLLQTEFSKPYFIELENFVKNEYASNHCYPPINQVFNALKATSFDEVKVVVLGQDPYHGSGQANGLAFSVNDGVAMPPSLRNIFKEIQNDIGKNAPVSGNLEYWSNQGVLLLNTVLSVRGGTPDSHKGKGWEMFTDELISILSEKKQGLIFLLWGAKAHKKKGIIDAQKHYILEAGHPSPLSAYRGFFGCKHFSKTNEILQKQGKEAIKW